MSHAHDGSNQRTIRSRCASDDRLPGRGRWRTPRQAHPHAPGPLLPAALVALWWTLACRLNRRRMPDGPVTYTTPLRTEATMDQNIPPARATWHDYLAAGYLLASGVATAITTATDYLYGTHVLASAEQAERDQFRKAAGRSIESLTS